ncbi:MAG: hypothetical protein JWN29_124 [Acidimicrobiales bacterium]|nr:hypothetical protein [Acidimicrobiales bacterium]
MHLPRRALAAAVLVTLVGTPAASAAEGDADPAFGGGRPVAVAGLSADVLAVQPDGKVLVLGADRNGAGIRLARLLTDGTLDPSFGTGGQVSVDTRSFDVAGRLAVADDGLIYASDAPPPLPRSSRLDRLWRFLPSGAPDPAFGTGGVVDFDGFGLDQLAPLPEGRAVLAVSGDGPFPGDEGRLWALRADGSRDTTFAGHGERLLPGRANGLVRAGDRLVVDAPSAFSPDAAATLVVRLDLQGAPDPGFGWGGVVALPPGDSGGHGVVVDRDGRLVVRADRPRRLLGDGRPDPSFDASAYGMAGGPIGVLADGSVIVQGPSGTARVGTDGGWDRSFGPCGAVASANAAVGADGRVYVAAGDGVALVQTSPGGPNQPLPGGQSLIELQADGLRTYGSPCSFGSLAGRHLNRPVVGLARTPSGNGYWIVAGDGGIFSFGDARFLGSTGSLHLNQPIVGMAATPSGRGYWLVARDGGVFTFGDAVFRGSTGSLQLRRPIVGMAATPSGRGYWLVAGDGGIFTFGDARFLGSTGGTLPARPVVGMAATPSGAGYWIVAADGRVLPFGDARRYGDPTDVSGLTGPGFTVAGIVPTPSGQGYFVVDADDRDLFVSRYGDAFPIPLSHHEGGGRVIAVA